VAHLILGTAGHIDHGKTTLVRRLTGAAGDRLPAEKLRGLTIDLGFSRLTLGRHAVGVVDVPGHERFVRNMLAGATGLDLALLVVAADDGPMPQTREHLAILGLLGVRHGVVALTKCDLVSAERCGAAAATVRELLAATGLAEAEVVPISADGDVSGLLAALERAADRCGGKAAGRPFRLAIDRAFTVAGHGTVVTGTVASGELRVGDEIHWHRGPVPERVRVRGLTVHGEPMLAVTAGQRAGVNVAGVELSAVCRGQELAAPGSLVPSRVLTCRLIALTGEVIRHRLPVRLHLGTAEVMAEASVLDAERVEPGTPAVGQLFLADPVVAIWGQPLILRDPGAERTLGGGRVLDPSAVRLRRRHVEHVEQIARLDSPDTAVRADAAVWLAGFDGVSADDLGRRAGVWRPDPTPLVRLDGRRLWHPTRVAAVERQVSAVLAVWHAEQPLVTAHDRGRLTAAIKGVPQPVTQAVIDRMLAAGRLTGNARRVAAVEFAPTLSQNQRKLKDRIVAAHTAAGFSPPAPADFPGGAALFPVAVAEGLLVPVGRDLYLTAEWEAELRRVVVERLTAGPATMSELRQLLGTTRKYSLPFGEYLDGLGLTVRDGDFRRLRGVVHGPARGE
jgi:selenocysteine-specific elongation factor